MEHHQHNGNVGAVIPYIDSNEKGIELDSGIPTGDDERVKHPGVERSRELEVVTAVDEHSDKNIEEGNKDGDDYVHSLWQWPTGRSCFVKVSRCENSVFIH